MSAPPYLQACEVRKRFGSFTALDGVSLDIAEGELVCLLGPSGCGKTTLLRCIAGLERQDSGILYMGGRDISHLPPQARALAPSPSLLLLDEPMSALDARVREHLCTELRQLQKRLGITTLMVTHNQDEAMLMADRIAVMNHGRVEQYDTPEAIYRRPATPFVASFVGQGNWLPFEGRDGRHAQVGDLRLCLPEQAGEGASGHLFCRPEAIAVEPGQDDDNRFRAQVREITFLGNRCRVSFELDALPGHPLLAELDPAHMPRLGGPDIWVALPSRSLQVFA